MILIVLGRALQFLLTLAMMRVATTLLSPEEMGRVSLVLTTIAFFALFLVNPVGTFINRRIHTWQANGVARHYLIQYMIYLLLVALTAAVVIPLCYAVGVVNFGIPFGWLILLVCGGLIFNTVNQTAIPSLNLLGESRKFILLSIATIIASFACATLLVKIFQPVAQLWLLGLLLGQTIVGVIGAKILFEYLKQPETNNVMIKVSRRHQKTLFNFAWPVAIAAGMGWIQGQGYRYLMEGHLGLAQLGLFVAGYGISLGMIAGFESVLATYFQPRLYRDANSGHAGLQAQAWQRYANAVIPSLVLTVALVMMLAPELTHLFLGADFQSAADFVIWGALAETARVLVGTYSLIAHVNMRTNWLIIPNLVGALLAVTLCVLLIPLWGATGVGFALVISGFATVLTMHFLLMPYVGGGISKRPVLMAIFVSTVLWGATVSLRNLLTGWVGWLILLGMIGMAYLGMQYLFLRSHMIEKREA